MISFMYSIEADTNTAQYATDFRCLKLEEKRMSKVAIIGAGSLVFTKQFLNDMFGTPCMAGSTYYLMGPTMWKLEKMKVYADQIIEKNKVDAKIVCTTDRREALKDADFVVMVFYIGGNEAFGYDVEIPMKYGINQCIGDSMGPGGFFRDRKSVV